MFCGYVFDFVFEIKSIFFICIYICRIVLGEYFYEYCVIMVKKIIFCYIYNRINVYFKDDDCVYSKFEI